MRTTHQYRLRLSQQQVATFEDWLELARRQYNYRLGERFSWWERHRCDIDRCSLEVCHLPELKHQPDYYSQKQDLVNTKQLFPEYKALPSHLLQDVIARVEKAYDRFVTGNSNGKRSGRPRFKGKGRYHSLTFPDPIKPQHLQGKWMQLPKIGKLKMILHRPIPDGFAVKTATITKRADGWYINLSLQDTSVPELTPPTPTAENILGIDMGLKSFLVTSEGEEVTIPRHYRKAEKRLKRVQRSLSRKQQGSKRRVKAVKRVAGLHQRVGNQRRDFHYKTAKRLLGKAQVVAHEDLNIKGLAKSMLAKSVNDAGWGQFLQILKIKAASAGCWTVAVNPNGTTQRCSGCGTTVPKPLSERVHTCPHCALEMDRDHNAALNIKHLAVGHPVSKAQEMPDGIPGVTEKPALYASA